MYIHYTKSMQLTRSILFYGKVRTFLLYGRNPLCASMARTLPNFKFSGAAIVREYAYNVKLSIDDKNMNT